jgi:hypothetical protein
MCTAQAFLPSCNCYCWSINDQWRKTTKEFYRTATYITKIQKLGGRGHGCPAISASWWSSTFHGAPEELYHRVNCTIASTDHQSCTLQCTSISWRDRSYLDHVFTLSTLTAPASLVLSLQHLLCLFTVTPIPWPLVSTEKFVVSLTIVRGRAPRESNTSFFRCWLSLWCVLPPLQVDSIVTSNFLKHILDQKLSEIYFSRQEFTLDSFGQWIYGATVRVEIH